jgi:hypothetical protein
LNNKEDIDLFLQLIMRYILHVCPHSSEPDPGNPNIRNYKIDGGDYTLNFAGSAITFSNDAQGRMHSDARTDSESSSDPRGDIPHGVLQTWGVEPFDGTEADALADGFVVETAVISGDPESSVPDSAVSGEPLPSAYDNGTHIVPSSDLGDGEDASDIAVDSAPGGLHSKFTTVKPSSGTYLKLLARMDRLVDNFA